MERPDVVTRASAEKSHKSQVMAFTIGALVLVLVLVLYFTFRYYPEKKAAGQFFNALVAGDTDKAYELWKPTPSYQERRFSRRLGNVRLLRPGEKLQNHECESAGQERFHRGKCRAQSLFAIAQFFRCGEKPEDQSGYSVGFTEG